MKLSTASNFQLDWLIAKHLNLLDSNGKLSEDYCNNLSSNQDGGFTTDWAQGGPLFSEARISASIDDSGVWIAWCQYNYADEKRFMQSGDTELEAKARCYVAMNCGLTIEVPENV